MKTAMHSCAGRFSERDRSLAELARVGIRNPVVYLSPCDPPTHEGAVHSTMSALAMCQGHDVFLVEDDILVDDSLLVWLRLARQQRHPVTFCTVFRELYPEPVLDALDSGEPLPSGLHPVTNMRRWKGSMAVYLPEALVHGILREWRAHRYIPPRGGTDVWLRRFFLKVGAVVHIAVPNPVQHQDTVSTLARPSRKPRLSQTFGVPGTLLEG